MWMSLAGYPCSKVSLWEARIVGFGRIRLKNNLASLNSNLTFHLFYHLSRRKLASLSLIWSKSWRHLGDNAERCRYRNGFARTILLSDFFHPIPSLNKSVVICSIRFSAIVTFHVTSVQVPESILGAIQLHRFRKLRVFPGMCDNCIIRWPVLFAHRSKKCCIDWRECRRLLIPAA